MSTNNTIGTNIIIIHEKQGIARFFEGILRNGFRPKTFTDIDSAVKSIRADPPDLILCDIKCLDSDEHHLANVLESNFGVFELPLILVTEDQSDDELPILQLRAVDYVPRSINPSLLKWKIKTWLCLKNEVDRIQESGFEATERAGRLESQMQTFLHDIRSPVTAIRGCINRLRRYSDPVSFQAQREAAIDLLDNISRSLEDLLDSTKAIPDGPDAAEWEPIRLDEVVLDVILQHQYMIEDSGITVLTETAGYCHPLVIGSKTYVRRVLDNLVLNAIKHMGQRPDPRITITMAENCTFVVTRIHDNGIGIPEQYLNNVFDRFFRVPGSDGVAGSGLGLSTVKQIVERHNGKVWVESEPGNGTTFSFTLPKFYSEEMLQQGQCRAGAKTTDLSLT